MTNTTTNTQKIQQALDAYGRAQFQLGAAAAALESLLSPLIEPAASPPPTDTTTTTLPQLPSADSGTKNQEPRTKNHEP